jgi:hypothetical protein
VFCSSFRRSLRRLILHKYLTTTYPPGPLRFGVATLKSQLYKNLKILRCSVPTIIFEITPRHVQRAADHDTVVLVLGKPPHEKFAYTLSSTSNVGELKTTLKDLNWHGHPVCDDVAAELVARDIPNGGELLESLKPLSEVFGTHGGPAVDLLPVIIQVPETLHAAVVD